MTLAAPQQVRLFVALVPPAALQTQVMAIQTEIWQQFHSQAALKSPPHITLQPPFQRSLKDLSQLYNWLGHIACQRSPISLQLSGYQAFVPRVIYLDVVPNPALQSFQASLQAAFAATFQIQPPHPGQAFTPHLTVAFRDLKPAAFRQAWAEFKDRPFEATFTATHLTLLRHDGQRWQIAAEFPFRNPIPGSPI